jgi:phospholipid-binding lipoprotein MlaA
MRRSLYLLLIGATLLALESAPLAVGEGEPRDQGATAEEAPLPEGPDPLFEDEDFDLELGEAGFPDPLEPLNRPILRFNREVDRWVLDPVTRVYRFLLPDFAERAVYRVFLNLETPPILVNDLLQLEWCDAGVTLARFVVNTVFGLGGLFDAGERLNLVRHESDFGQTLALAGIPSGSYLVLPVLGPSNLRDGAGEVVDAFLRPTTYIVPLLSPQQLFYSGSFGLSVRAANYEALKALQESSVDYYAALRNAYYQSRTAHIWFRREDRRHDWDPPADASRPQGGAQ